MLIEIESVYGDKLIHGNHLDREELQNALKEILQKVSEKDFSAIFCARYGYEELRCSDTVRVDYIIDLDTHLLNKPKY
jgi:predicted nucleic-acid-binding Zn-ribbon protein